MSILLRGGGVFGDRLGDRLGGGVFGDRLGELRVAFEVTVARGAEGKVYVRRNDLDITRVAPRGRLHDRSRDKIASRVIANDLVSDVCRFSVFVVHKFFGESQSRVFFFRFFFRSLARTAT